MILDIGHRRLSLGVIKVAVENAQNVAVDIPAAGKFERLEQERIQPTAVCTNLVGIIDRVEPIVGEMLQRQHDIVTTALGEVRLHVGNQLGDADSGVPLLEKSQGEIETYAIDLKGIEPIHAHIPNELGDAAVVVVELLKETASCEVADVGRIRRIHVQPEIRKAVVRIDSRPHVIEDAIHNDVNVPRMQLVYELLQSEKLVRRIGWIVDVTVLHGEELNGIVSPAEAASGSGGPRHELDSIDA